MSVSRKVCADLLRKELETAPITSQKQVGHMLERLAACFVAVSDDVYKIGLELYGNGSPGGMKVELNEIKLRQDNIQETLKMLEDSLVSNGDIDKRKPDTFDNIVAWFTNKVLPALVIGFLMGMGNLTLFLAFIFYAYTYGLLVIP